MKDEQIHILISREKRSYFFASLCSAIAALSMFYKVFQNDLYLKILKFPWFAFVVILLILGNTIHGFFAFKSYNELIEDSDLEKVKSIKKVYYKSFLVNFLVPYIVLILLFIFIKEFLIAFIALILFSIMSFGCYYFDLKPTMNLK